MTRDRRFALYAVGYWLFHAVFNGKTIIRYEDDEEAESTDWGIGSVPRA